MSNLINPLPFTLSNGTNADASQVMANLNQIANDVNSGIDSYVSDLINDSTITSPTIVTPIVTTPTITGGTVDSTTTGVTAAPATNTTGLATTAFVQQELNNFDLSGPINSVGRVTTIENSVNLPGNPTTTTQTFTDNSTKIATTAFVNSRLSTGGQFQTLVLNNISSDTTITLPANAAIIGALFYISSGSFFSGSGSEPSPNYTGASISFSNIYNPFVGASGNSSDFSSAFNYFIGTIGNTAGQVPVFFGVNTGLQTAMKVVNVPTTLTVSCSCIYDVNGDSSLFQSVPAWTFGTGVVDIYIYYVTV